MLRHRNEPNIVTAVADALREILHHSLQVTRKSLLEVGVLNVLAKCIPEHAQWTESPNPLEVRARAAELAFMVHIIDNII